MILHSLLHKLPVIKWTFGFVASTELFRRDAGFGEDYRSASGLGRKKTCKKGGEKAKKKGKKGNWS